MVKFQMLGFEISDRTVARCLQRLRRRGDRAGSLRAFLANHREAIVAFDFFTVPTATFRLLYCFFVIERPPKNFALQRDCSSNLRLGSATTPRSLP
jgi:hypothetical protein